MKLEITILLFVAITLTTAKTLVNDRGNRIMGGETAEPGMFPYMVKIISWYDQINTSDCGGSLITLSRVLTAAHCFGRISITIELDVIAGALDPFDYYDEGRQAQTVPTSRVTVHPQYIPPPVVINDIAYIDLPEPFTESLAVQVIRYAMAGEFPNLAGRTATIAGWGSQGPVEEEDPNLQWMESRILSDEECRTHWGSVDTNTMICFYVNNITAVCEGDSGGPLTIQDDADRPIQVGLVSFGDGLGCGPATWQATVFTRIDQFINFFQP